MKHNFSKETIDDFIRTLDDQLVCISFKSDGIPLCTLHHLKRGVFVKTKYTGGLFFLIDPSKNEYFFKLFDTKSNKVRWSCPIPGKGDVKLTNDQLMVVCDLHALRFEDAFNKDRYVKQLCDIFDEEFDPNTITFYRKEKTMKKRQKKKTKKNAKSKKKEQKKVREPFTSSPLPSEKENSSKKKKKNSGKEECVALFDYKAKTPLELSVKEGDVLKIHGINTEEGFIVGEIINPGDMAVSAKSKRRGGKSGRTKKKKSAAKLGQIPEHYTNHLLDEYRQKLKQKDNLEGMMKKWERYKDLEEKRLKKREEELELRESHIEQDRLQANREVGELKSKLQDERKKWESDRKKVWDEKKKKMEQVIHGRRNEMMKNEKQKRKELTIREKKLQREEERNSRQGKRLVDKEQQLKELSSRISRRTKRIKAREKHMNEKEQIIDVQERRFKERNYDIKKLEVKLVKKDKMLQKKERELRRQEGLLNKKRFAIQLPSEIELEKELEDEKKKRQNVQEKQAETSDDAKKVEETEEETEKNKKKNIDDTVFHDLLKKQQEVDQMSNEIEDLRRKISEGEKTREDLLKENEQQQKELALIRSSEKDHTQQPLSVDVEVQNIISSQKRKIESLLEKVKKLQEKMTHEEETIKESMRTLIETQETELRKMSEEYEKRIEELKSSGGGGGDGGEEEVGKLRVQVTSLLKLKEGEASNEIKKLKSSVKKLKSQNKKLTKKITMLEEISQEQKKKIESQQQQQQSSTTTSSVVIDDNKIYRGRYSHDEINQLEKELRSVVRDSRYRIRHEQLWFQKNFSTHSNQTRVRLNDLSEQIKKRADYLEKRDDELDSRDLKLKELENKLNEREKRMKEEEDDQKEVVKEPNLDLEGLKNTLDKEAEKLNNKELLLKDWEDELKKREKDLNVREEEIDQQRMKFFQEKQQTDMIINRTSSPTTPKKELQGGSKSPKTPPRRISEVKHMTQESPGRLQYKKTTDASMNYVRPRRMSRESPGRLETSPKSPKGGDSGGNTSVEVPNHLKPSFGKLPGGGGGRFNFILGRYEHRIKHMNQEKRKTQDFEEKKQEKLSNMKPEDIASLRKLLSSGRLRRSGDGGVGGSVSSPTSLPSPLDVNIKLRKNVETKPPIPSKVRRLKTDELADIIFSPKMKKEQLMMFEDYQNGENDEDSK